MSEWIKSVQKSPKHKTYVQKKIMENKYNRKTREGILKSDPRTNSHQYLGYHDEWSEALCLRWSILWRHRFDFHCWNILKQITIVTQRFCYEKTFTTK